MNKEDLKKIREGIKAAKEREFANLFFVLNISWYRAFSQKEWETQYLEQRDIIFIDENQKLYKLQKDGQIKKYE